MYNTLFIRNIYSSMLISGRVRVGVPGDSVRNDRIAKRLGQVYFVLPGWYFGRSHSRGHGTCNRLCLQRYGEGLELQ